MTNKQAVIEIVLKAIDKASSVLKDVGGSLSSFGASIGRTVMGGVNMAIDGIQALAGTVTRFVASAMEVASEFESKMSVVNSILHRSQDEMNKLGEEAMRLGRLTRFSADDAADAMATLASAGLSYELILNGATEAVLALAAATKGDLKGAAQVFASVVNMFHLSGQEALAAVDALAGAANNANLSLPALAAAFRAVGAQAYALKMPITDVTTMLGMFGRAGITGTEAGTQLARVLMYLTPMSSKAADMMQKLGLITADGKNQFFGLHGELKSGREIIDVLSKSLRGMTDEQKQHALHVMFGAKAMRAANLLVSEGIEGYDKLAKVMADTSAADMAAERMNNYKGAMDRLQDTWKTMKIAFASGLLLPIGKDVANWLNDMLSALSPLTDWAYENGPAMWARFKVKLSDWFDASGLEEVFAPIKTLLDSLSAGGMGQDEALTKMEDAFRETFRRIKAWAKKELSGLLEGSDVAGGLSSLIDSAFGSGSSKKAGEFAEKIDNIVSGISDLVTFFSDVHTAWTTKVLPVLNWSLPGTSWAKFDYGTVKERLGGLRDTLNTPLGPKIEAFFAFDVGKALGLNDASKALDEWWDGVVAWFGGLGKRIAGLFGKSEDSLVEPGWREKWGDKESKNVVDKRPGGKDYVPDMIGLPKDPGVALDAWWVGVKAWFSGIPAKIAALFGGGGGEGGGAGGAGGGGGFSITTMLGLDGATQTLSDWAAGLPGAVGSLITDAFTAVFGPVPETVQTSLDEIGNAVDAKWGAIHTATVAKWDEIKESLSTKWDEMKTDVATKVEEIKTNVSDKWNEIKTNVGQTLSDMHQDLQGRWDGFLREVGQKMDSILSKTSEKWESLKTATAKKLSEMGDDIKSKWSAFASDVDRFASDMRDKATNRWNELKSNASRAWDDVKSDAASKWGAISVVVSTWAATIWTNVTAKAKQIHDDLAGWWDKARTTAESKWNEIKTAVSKKWDELVNFVKGKLSAWEDIGRGIVEGIKRGWDRFMLSMREGFWSAVQDLLDWIAGKLGINSPARATMPFGSAMGEGIQVAFVSWMQRARSSMVGAVMDVVGAIGRVIGDSGPLRLLSGGGTLRVVSGEGAGATRPAETVRDELLGLSIPLMGRIARSMESIGRAIGDAWSESGVAPSFGDGAWDEGEDRSRLTRPIGPKMNFTRKGRGGMIYTSQYHYWEKWSAYHNLPIPEGVQDKGRAFSPEALEAIRAYTKKMVDAWREALDAAARKQKVDVPGTGGGSDAPPHGIGSSRVPGQPGDKPPIIKPPPPIVIHQTVIVKMGQTEIARQVAESEPIAAWKADIWPVGVS